MKFTVTYAYFPSHNHVSVMSLTLTIVSDRDPRFTGKFFAELCRLMDVKQSFSSAFHPQSDGQTERVNRVLFRFAAALCRS
jgi:transposase InsO family protein